MESAKCLITFTSNSVKWGQQHRRTSFLVGAPRVPSRDFQGEKSKVWSSLAVLDNFLVEGIVLRARSFSRVKTYDLGSGDDDACALFPS